MASKTQKHIWEVQVSFGDGFHEVYVEAETESEATDLVDGFDPGKLFNFVEAEVAYTITDCNDCGTAEECDMAPLTKKDIKALTG